MSRSLPSAASRSDLVRALGLALAYYVAGRLSVLPANPREYAMTVWPPAGIALAGLLLFGYRVWPGILFAAFFTTLGPSFHSASAAALLQSTGAAAGLGTGAVLQASAGAWLIRRFVGFPAALDEAGDVAKFLILGGPAACALGAAWSVATLTVAGVEPWSVLQFNWWTWWVGASIGVVVVTPLILVWAGEPRSVWRARRISVGLPLLAAFALAVVVFPKATAWEQASAKFDFQQRSAALADALKNRVDGDIGVAYSIAGFYAGAGAVDRRGFRAFAGGALSHHPGITALEWIPRVPAGQRDVYERAAQRDGYPAFRIHARGRDGANVPVGPRGEYFPVYFVEPAQGNASALGFDAASDPDERAALLSARDAGTPVATPRIPLMTGTGRSSGVLVFLPVYESGSSVSTVELRRRNLKGFAVLALRPEDVARTTLAGSLLRGVDLRIYDDAGLPGPELLWSSVPAADVPSSAGTLSWHIGFSVADRRWSIQASPGSGYLSPRGSWQLWAVLATALAFTGLLASLLLIVTGRTLKSEALALENSGLYRRYRSLFDGVPVGLYRAAEDGQILDVNPAFLRMLDYPSRDALEALNAAHLYLDPKLWERWRTHLEHDAATTDFESQLKRADGSLLWVQASISATRDAAGRIAYYEGAIVDITERKQAEAHVEALNVIVTAAAGAADLQTFLDTLLDRTLAALEGDHGGVWLGAGIFVNRRMPAGLGMETVMSAAEAAGLELTQVQAVENWDLAAGPLAEALGPNIRRAGVRSSLMGALVVDGRQIGGLLITTARPRRWLAPELRLVEAVGRQIGAVAERLQLLDDVRAHARDIETLHGLGAALRRTTSLGEIYALITERTMALLRGDHAELLLLEPDGRTFQRASARTAKTVPLGAASAVGAGIATTAIERAGAFVIPDLTAASAASVGAAPADGIMGPGVAVPLREGERVIGALVAARRRDTALGPFVARDADLATALAELASHAIDRTQLAQQVANELANVRGLYEGAQRMAETLDLQSLAGEAVNRCVEVFGAKFAWIAKFDEAGRPQCLAHHPDVTDVGPFIDDWTQSIAAEAVRAPLAAGQPAVVQNLGGRAGATAPLPAELDLRARGTFPLIGRTRTFGALVLYAGQTTFFTKDRVEFFQAYAHQLAGALENARLYDDANRRLEQLQALHEIDQVITGSLDLNASLSVVLAKTVTQLHADAACVLLFNPHLQVLEYAAGQGFSSDASRHVRLRLGEGLPGQAALERRRVGVSNLDAAPDASQLIGVPHRRLERFKAAYAAPLTAKGQLLGVLHVLYRQSMTPNDEWLEFFDMLAGQTAIAISDARQFRALQRSHDDLMLAYDTTLAGWARALELRDKETAGHTQRVTELALLLASRVGVPESEFIHLRHGALLHDIGKMAISDTILLKPERLNPDERAMMERHPVYARDLLMPIPYLRPVLDIPYCHHEKWDGSGYPRGLTAEQIPLAARIFAVVDVWDALTQDRPYRPAWSDDRAREYIRGELGRHFDPRVGETFLRMLDENAVGRAENPGLSLAGASRGVA